MFQYKKFFKNPFHIGEILRWQKIEKLIKKQKLIKKSNLNF